MEVARTSETSVGIHLRTRQYNPEDSELHTRRSENIIVAQRKNKLVYPWKGWQFILHCYVTQ
jgi:hypothetical protein